MSGAMPCLIFILAASCSWTISDKQGKYTLKNYVSFISVDRGT